MLDLKTPRGLPVRVPENSSEDPSPQFDIGDSEGIKRYYEENGYVIVKSVFTPDVCKKQRALWDREVKPFGGHIYRQATAKAEKHIFNDKGWVMNPILNLQSVDPKQFPAFRHHATNEVLAAAPLRDLFKVLLRDTPKIVQSMYFEGNSATWEHQDSYYLDSENIGEMAAAWIAVEDISPRAGRFFICPKSHKIKLADHAWENNIAEHHDVYIESVVAKIRDLSLEIRAPGLQSGDVLFWNALTIHGSLDSQDPLHSRSSITCHAIPRSRRLLSLQTQLHDVGTDEINGTSMFRPKDLRAFRNRLIFRVEANFPSIFYWAKQKAIKHLMRRKAS
jgi:phytanoyl-CoA hydroxylase